MLSKLGGRRGRGRLQVRSALKPRRGGCHAAAPRQHAPSRVCQPGGALRFGSMPGAIAGSSATAWRPPPHSALGLLPSQRTAPRAAPRMPAHVAHLPCPAAPWRSWGWILACRSRSAPTSAAREGELPLPGAHACSRRKKRWQHARIRLLAGPPTERPLLSAASICRRAALHAAPTLDHAVSRRPDRIALTPSPVDAAAVAVPAALAAAGTACGGRTNQRTSRRAAGATAATRCATLCCAAPCRAALHRTAPSHAARGGSSAAVGGRAAGQVEAALPMQGSHPWRAPRLPLCRAPSARCTSRSVTTTARVGLMRRAAGCCGLPHRGAS